MVQARGGPGVSTGVQAPSQMIVFGLASNMVSTALTQQRAVESMCAEKGTMCRTACLPGGEIQCRYVPG
jgi:hypothetical protein